MEPLTETEQANAAARIAARKEADERADEAINFTVERLGRRLALLERPGSVPAGTAVSESTARQSAPAMFYGPTRAWTAVGYCKPRKHRYRLLRGHGRTIRAALADLDRQLGRFERGERDGEQ